MVEDEPPPSEASTGEGTPTLPAWGRKYRRLAVPLLALGVVALVFGSLLLLDLGSCTPVESGVPCGLDTCVTSTVCPLAPFGVVVISLSLLVLGLGVAFYVGPRPEGESPHPEPGSRRGPERARARLEREREERRQERRDRED